MKYRQILSRTVNIQAFEDPSMHAVVNVSYSPGERANCDEEKISGWPLIDRYFAAYCYTPFLRSNFSARKNRF